MGVSTYNKGTKGDVFRAWILFMYLLQTADSSPKVGCLPLVADKPQKTWPWAGPDGGMLSTMHVSTLLWEGADGHIDRTCWASWISWITGVFWSRLPDTHTTWRCLSHPFFL